MIDKKKALKIVDFEAFKFKELPENFKKDKDVALKAVKNMGVMLEFAHDSLKNDKKNCFSSS